MTFTQRKFSYGYQDVFTGGFLNGFLGDSGWDANAMRG